MIDLLSLAGVGTYYLLYFALYLAGCAGTLILVRALRARLSRRVRTFAIAIVSLLLVRLVLFDNPFTLQLYKSALTTQSLGWRQSAVLELEVRKYKRDIHQRPLANLALGSSQVGAIFYQWPSDREPMGVYSLAGMKALDFVLNEDRIVAFNPQRLILFLSAFDMTGSPELFSLPLAPPKPQAIWPTVSALRRTALTWGDLAPSVHGYIGSQLVPEYRYSFVYRAFLKQWFGELTPPQEEGTGPNRLTLFSSYYDPKWLEYNFLFLDEFLAFCAARSINVVIVEGQVNPDARTDTINELNARVRSRLEGLRMRFPNIRYVPTSATYEFTADEYHDMTHPKVEAARKFTAALASYLRGR